MKWLIALLAAIGAAAVGVLFWLRKGDPEHASWHQAKDSASAWSQTAADKAGEAGDKLADAAADVADAAG
jgi:hypothetical protein